MGKNCRGFILIELLVASAILGIIVLAMSQMMVSMRKEIKGIELKQDVASLRNFILQNMSQSDRCTMHVEGLVVNANSLATATLRVHDDAIYTGTKVAKVMIAKEGEKLTPNGLSYSVQQIRLRNFIRVGPDSFKADLTVGFGNLPGFSAVADLTVPLFLSTDPTTPDAAKTILSCGAEYSLYARCVPRTVLSPGPSYHEVCCHPNELLMSFASPLDPENSAFKWTSKGCAGVTHVEVNHPIQLLCCP